MDMAVSYGPALIVNNQQRAGAVLVYNVYNLKNGYACNSCGTLLA